MRPDNTRAVFAALKELGAPLAGLTAEDFTDPESFYQMGRPPLRVDVMMIIPGVSFEEAWPRRETVQVGGIFALFICREDLIRAKQATARPHDLIDLANLRKSP